MLYTFLVPFCLLRWADLLYNVDYILYNIQTMWSLSTDRQGNTRIRPNEIRSHALFHAVIGTWQGAIGGAHSPTAQTSYLIYYFHISSSSGFLEIHYSKTKNIDLPKRYQCNIYACIYNIYSKELHQVHRSVSSNRQCINPCNLSPQVLICWSEYNIFWR